MVLANGCASAPGTPELVRREGPLEFPDGLREGRILVAGDPGDPPTGCDVRETVLRVHGLFRAISEGESDVVSRFFPIDRPEAFEWYSMNGPGAEHVDALDLDSLQRYLEARARMEESLELRGIQINRWTHGLAHFGPLLGIRQARDLPTGLHRLTGKGAVDCETGRLVALSLVTDPDPLPLPTSDGTRAVVSAVVRDVIADEPFGGHPERYREKLPVEIVVVQQELGTEFSPPVSEYVRERLPGLDSSTVADYESGGGVAVLQGEVHGPGEVRVVPRRQLGEILNNGGFRRFYQDFPGAAGLFVFSHVGWNTEGTQALVHALHLRAGDWGHEDFYLLRAEGEGWRVVGRVRTADI